MKFVLGSLATKVALLLAAMGVTTALAVIVAERVLEDTAGNLEVLTNERMQELTASDAVIGGVLQVKEATLNMLLASSTDELEARTVEARNATAGMGAAIDRLDADAGQAMSEGLSNVATAIAELQSARQEEFDRNAEFIQQLHEVHEIGDALADEISIISSTQIFELRSGGNDTIDEVDDGLELLVDGRFAALQLAYQLRAAGNLASGVSMGLSLAQDQGIQAILTDMAIESSTEMREILKDSEVFDYPIADPDVVHESVEIFEQLAANAQFFGAMGTDRVLQARTRLDRELLERIDEDAFSLVLEARQVSENNADAIEALLDGPVARIRDLGEMNSVVAAYVEAVLGIAVTEDSEALATAQERLTKQVYKLRAFVESQPVHISEHLMRLVDLGNTETGLAIVRGGALEANERAQAAVSGVVRGVSEIGEEAKGLAARTRQSIVASSNEVLGQVMLARAQFGRIQVAAVLLFAVAIVLGYILLVRPVLRLTATTERLAQGDLAEVSGFRRTGGEIARMANALSVFRNGLVEKERMEREAEARAVRERETAEAARKAEQQREELERERELKAEREARAREAEVARERAQMQAKTEAERRARAAEQDSVVESLAASLRQLADGNLDIEIGEAFPAEYDRLRSDFNAAIVRLRETIAGIAASGSLVHNSSTEISSVSRDLSQRTERTAASLEKTSSSLAAMTNLVKDSAERSSVAMTAVDSARNSAETGREIVRATVEAMEGINASAAQIREVTKVIDDISFQTNLLALNAGVEAARAGEAGRGFAVVASEVRALAQRSAEAAGEIGDMIDQSGKHVEQGVQLVDKTRTALEDILESVTSASEHAREIATAAGEQATGISSINESIRDLDNVTQRNAAMFEETSAASVALEAEAHNLDAAVSGFRFNSASHRLSNVG